MYNEVVGGTPLFPMELKKEGGKINNLKLIDADEDGFYLTDKEKDRCYIYDSEIDHAMQLLRKRKYEKENIRGQHSPSSSKNTINEKPIYKTFENYQDYIKSNEWKEKRRLRLKYDAHRCVNCGSTNDLEVHHLDYDSLGNEDIKADLRTLCSKCHFKKTGLDKKKKYKVVD